MQMLLLISNFKSPFLVFKITVFKIFAFYPLDGALFIIFGHNYLISYHFLMVDSSPKRSLKGLSSCIAKVFLKLKPECL